MTDYQNRAQCQTIRIGRVSGQANDNIKRFHGREAMATPLLLLIATKGYKIAQFGKGFFGNLPSSTFVSCIHKISGRLSLSTQYDVQAGADGIDIVKNNFTAVILSGDAGFIP